MTNQDVCVLVMSCDKYSDTWAPFFHFLSKNREDCPYPIYLVTNKKAFTHKNVNVINIKQSNRSEEMADVLDILNHEYVIYLQDDYFITEQVDNPRLNNLCELMKKFNLGYLRLYPEPLERVTTETPIDGTEKIVSGAPFITALQAAIRNKNVFRKLLVKGETIREFEIRSPKRTLNINQEFWSITSKSKGTNLHYPIQYFCTAIRRGKRRKKAVELCNNEGLTIDTSYRPLESRMDLFKKDYIYNRSPLWLKKLLTNVLR